VSADAALGAHAAAWSAAQAAGACGGGTCHDADVANAVRSIFGPGNTTWWGEVVGSGANVAAMFLALMGSAHAAVVVHLSANVVGVGVVGRSGGGVIATMELVAATHAPVVTVPTTTVVSTSPPATSRATTSPPTTSAPTTSSAPTGVTVATVPVAGWSSAALGWPARKL
jgi:hypothetical protein